MWSRLAFIGGGLQVLGVFALLFLPLYTDCTVTSHFDSTTNTSQTSGPICESHGFTDYHSVSGDLLFTLIAVVSLAFAMVSLAGNTTRRHSLQLILGGTDFVVTTFGICAGEGLILIPGVVLMLIAIVGEHKKIAARPIHSS